MIHKILNKRTGLLEDPVDVVKKMHTQVIGGLGDIANLNLPPAYAELVVSLIKCVSIADKLTFDMLEYIRQENKITGLPPLSTEKEQFKN
jgi:hypothetical protein